jgi:hypothetical protein
MRMLWKTVFAISSVITLIFAFDDLIGETQLKRIEEWWLSKSVKFFQEWGSGVRSIGGLWRLIVYAFTITLLPLLGPLILLLQDLKYPSVTLPEWISCLITPLILLVIPMLALALIGTLLSKPSIRRFLKTHRTWWETHYLLWLRKLLVWAEKSSKRMVPSEGAEAPYLSALVVIMITMPFVLVSSLILRGGLLILGVTAGAIIYVPPIVLDAIAKRTGAEHFFRVGKYVILVLTTVLALVQMFISPD